MNHHFGQGLEQLRKARGLTQEQLAEKAGVSAATITKAVPKAECSWTPTVREQVLLALNSKVRLTEDDIALVVAIRLAQSVDHANAILGRIPMPAPADIVLSNAPDQFKAFLDSLRPEQQHYFMLALRLLMSTGTLNGIKIIEAAISVAHSHEGLTTDPARLADRQALVQIESRVMETRRSAGTTKAAGRKHAAG